MRQSSEPHQPLVQFLSIDAAVYKRGLVVKKLDKLISECQENEYLRSIGYQKRVNEQHLQRIKTVKEALIEDEYED